jgi:hypothetical protein
VAKLPAVEKVLVEKLSASGGGRPLKTGLIISSHQSLGAAVAGSGHRVLILGSHFKTLWKIAGASGSINSTVLIVECLEQAYPIKEGSLDVLICAGNIKFAKDVKSETAILKELKKFLKTGGELFLLSPLKQRFLKRVFMKIRQRKPLKPHELCQSVMAAGFCSVGQKPVRVHRRGTSILTVGKAVDTSCPDLL